MPLPEHDSNRGKRLFRERQPGILPGAVGSGTAGPKDYVGAKDFQNSQTEHNFRHPDLAAEVKAPAAARAATPTVTAAAPQLPPVITPTIIDRWHKRSVSTYGGYIDVGRDHDLRDTLETAQTPPKNPGYAPLGNASSVQAAYIEAARLQPLVKGRIAICIHGGTWFEEFAVTVPGIDFFGIGQPAIVGLVQRFAPSDAQFRGMDFIATNTVFGGLHFGFSPDTNPVYAPGGLFGCRFYGDVVASTFESRFYAEDCHWFQTSDASGTSETAVPLVVQMSGGEAGESRLKGCSVHSWYTPANTPMGRKPGGYAISALCTSPGPGATAYQWPQSMLVLDHCEIYGSLLSQETLVEHRNCSVHGGLDTPTHTGGVYAVMRGRPLFDGEGTFVGYISGRIAMTNCAIHSNLIAKSLPYTGSYPPGVTPSTYPGQAVLDLRNSVHLSRAFTGAAATPFVPGGASNIANVVQCPTACAAWTTSGWSVNTYGDCPVGVANGLFDYYLL